MWLTQEFPPDQGETVLVRFNKEWNDNNCEYDYTYATAYYEGNTFYPDGVDVTYDMAGVIFEGNPREFEWKRIPK